MSNTAPHQIPSAPFGHLPDGTAATYYTLQRDGGLRVGITDFGAAIVSLWAPDRRGEMADVVLGYESVEGYVAGKSFFGGIIGRYGNRIAGGRFTLDGVEHLLPRNNGENHLHGGPGGFDRVMWQARPVEGSDAPALRLTRLSADGEEGYPGALRVEVTYTLTAVDTLRIDYRAETDRPTVVNLTNHAYFNLSGHHGGTILDHELTVPATCFTPTDAGLIPTGELRAVAGTAFDFREPHRIGERIGADTEQLRFAGGYDHNFVLDRSTGADLELAARLREPRSGRVMNVFTTEPGIQIYSGNFLAGTEVGKGGHAYLHRTGICLETQHFPDSPNQPAFLSTVLRPGEIHRSSTSYRFTAE